MAQAVPNCPRCGGTVFTEVPYRTEETLPVTMVCCSGCMAVVGAFRTLNPVQAMQARASPAWKAT